MKSFLATTAIVLLMGGSAYAASAKLDAYQAQASDIDASKFIGQTVYASKTDISSDQKVAGASKDWDNIGDINEVVFDRNGSVKAVVIGVGGFLGMGEKNVSVSLNDIKFVRNGNGANDYFLVVNSTKEALNAAPAFKTPDEIREASNTPPATDATTNGNTTTAANPDLTAPADNTASNTTTNDMSKSKMSNNTAANTTITPADNSATSTDKTTTASTTNNNTSVQTTMNDNRARLTPPTVTREGYASAKVEDLTADKLEGATVYGPKDENIGKISHLVMNDNGKGVKFFVLDVGGFLGIGAHTIAVTPQELNIVRDAKGDDIRVYIDANKQALKAQPEYKVQ
jgi:hypothetical protein